MLNSAPQPDPYATLSDNLRWRVALVLGLLICVLMVTLALINRHLGLADTQRLAWISLAVATAAVCGLLLLPKRTGATLFFLAIAALLVLVPAYGFYHGRAMQYWAYVLPPLLIFLLRPGAALASMIAYGVYVSWITSLLLTPIEVIRFASGYGLTVCFMYTYALLQNHAARLLRFHSTHDALTNCLNRRTFNQAIAALDSQGSAGDRDLLLLDIDHFKEINDHHGHLVGDRVIAEVAQALSNNLRPGTPLYRYGGEEFAVIVPGEPDGSAADLPEQLRLAIERADCQGLKVTISVGVARWHIGLEKPEAALQRADDALYLAKRSGRNRVMRESPRERSNLRPNESEVGANPPAAA